MQEKKLVYAWETNKEVVMYFVTTIDTLEDDNRCVGYFKTFEEAEHVVLDNVCDIWETCYNFVVIENIKEGLYQYDYDAKWYEWNYDKKRYEKTDKIPGAYQDQIGFAIG